MSKAPSTSKADTAVKLVLVFFISLLSFSVGTYVGKQVSESEARQAALEADYNNHDGHATAAHEGAGEEATAPISEAESNSLAEEFVKGARKTASEGDGHGEAPNHGEKNEHGDGHGEKAEHGDGHGDVAEKSENDGGHGEKAEHGVKAQHGGDNDSAKKEEHGEKNHAHGEAATSSEAAKSSEAPTSSESAKSVEKEDGYTHHSKMKAATHEETGAGHGAPDRHAAAVEKPAPGKPSSAAERVSHDMAPAADPVKKAEPPSHLPSVATTAIGKYTVQVASYATEDEAKNHVSRLAGKGYSPFYVRADVGGKTWYRVSIGLFSDQKSATNYRTELLATQAVASAIVQKIVK